MQDRGALLLTERYVTRNGIAKRKVFLYVSRAEQKRRLHERLEMHEKNWQSLAADEETQRDWKPYMLAYEETIRETSTDYAPGYAVPADHNWFTRLVVTAAVIEA